MLFLKMDPRFTAFRCVMLAFGSLQPTSKGKRIRLSGDKCTLIDGPFTETKELIAGYMIWQVQSMEEAVEWVKRSPKPQEGESEIETAII